ncbi:hypothetical protein G8T83_02365 [Clostridium botulinum D/C]|nr:hypothetical protein [Clostridium botulinum]MCD3361686.1 hypothetical protein [Clostridium botulinum D/C]
MKISSKFMDNTISICIAILIFSLVYRTINCICDKHDNINYDENFLTLIKFIFYFILARYIYLVFKRNNFPEIDILTFFTFLLAAFEATHNCINTVINFFALLISTILKKFK